MHDKYELANYWARRQKYKKIRDFQRSKVYSWERHLFRYESSDMLSLDECKKMVLSLIPFHKIKDGRGSRMARGSVDGVWLPRWSRYPAIVLHEVAHGCTLDKHGPFFMGCFIDLLVDHDLKSRSLLIRSAKDYNIKVNENWIEDMGASEYILIT